MDVEGLRLTSLRKEATARHALPPLQRRFVVKELRQASNEGTLRAFRYADRFPLSKSFAGRALFDDVSLQVNRGDLIASGRR